MSRHRMRRAFGTAGFYGCVLLLISPAILVFLWMLSLSLKNEVDNMAFPPVFIPNPPTLANFVDVFEKNDFLTYTINSVIVSFSATGLALLLGVPAIRHSEVPRHQGGRARDDRARHAGAVLPHSTVPDVSMLEMTGTLWPIVITHLVITIPIVIWIMIGFSRDFRRTGRGGAGRWRDDLAGLPPRRAATRAPRHHGRDDPGLHLQLEQLHLRRGARRAGDSHAAGRRLQRAELEQVSWGPLAAAALLVTAPVLILTLLMQREIVAGLTAGGVKGG